MDDSNDIDHPYEGQKFRSFEALKKYLEDYGKRNYVKFWIRSSHTRNSLKSKASKLMNPSFKYVCVKFACIFGGEKIRCRGSGIRKSSTYRNLGCPCMINAVVGEDGNHVKLDTVMLEHNHVLSKPLYDSLKNTKKKSLTLSYSLEGVHNGQVETSQNLRMPTNNGFCSSLVENYGLDKEEFNDTTHVLDSFEDKERDVSYKSRSKYFKDINDKYGNNVKIYLVGPNMSDEIEDSSTSNQTEDESDELPNLHAKICRLCLSPSDNLIPIFNPDLPVKSTVLSFKIMGCASIEIDLNDGLPNCICPICVATVDIAYNFRLGCEKSDSLLRKALLRREMLNTTRMFQRQANLRRVFNDKLSNKVRTSTESIIVDNEEITVNEDHPSVGLGIAPEIDENEEEVIQSSSEETSLLYQEVIEDEKEEESYSSQTYSIEVSPEIVEEEIGVEEEIEGVVEIPAQKTLITYPEVEQEKVIENYTPEEFILEATDEAPENVMEVVQTSTPETFVEYQEITEEESEIEEDYILKTPSRTYSKEGKRWRKENQKDTSNTSIQESVVSYQETTEDEEEGNSDQETFRSEETLKGMEEEMEHAVTRTFTLEERKPEPSSVEFAVSCLICGNSFENCDSMSDHLENHPINEIILLACNICSLICPSIKELQDHMKEHVKDAETDVYSCAICELTCSTAEELKNHEEAHFGTPTSTAQSTPTRTPSPTPQIQRTSELKYLCNFCGKVLKTKERFQAHQNTHKGLKPHICPKCGKGFADRKNMYQHNDVVHLKKVKHACPVCHKKFYTRTKMKSHITMHYDFKPFACDMCDKTFRLKMNMIKHKKTHSNDRPHQCDKCSAAFIDRNMLKRHSYVHGGVRPFLCATCGHRFSVRSHLKKHLEKSKCKKAAELEEAESAKWTYIPSENEDLAESDCILLFKPTEDIILEGEAEGITMNMLEGYNEVPNA